MKTIKTKDESVKIKKSNIVPDIVYNAKQVYFKGKKYTDRTIEDNEGTYEDADNNFEDTVENISASARALVKRKIKNYVSAKTTGIPYNASVQQKLKERFIHKKINVFKVATLKDKILSVSKGGIAFTNTAKLAIGNTKILLATLSGIGAFAMLFTVIICMIGLVMGSSFGIFMATEDTGTGYTLTNVISNINEEFCAEIENIKLNTQYDDLVITDSKPLWRDILAVYAVKITTDTEGEEVVTIDDRKENLIREIFWDMTQIVTEMETYEEVGTVEIINENGEIIDQEVILEKLRLIISVKNKTANEMSNAYGFNENQSMQLEELLSDSNSGLWSFIGDI